MSGGTLWAPGLDGRRNFVRTRLGAAPVSPGEQVEEPLKPGRASFSGLGTERVVTKGACAGRPFTVGLCSRLTTNHCRSDMYDYVRAKWCHQRTESDARRPP